MPQAALTSRSGAVGMGRRGAASILAILLAVLLVLAAGSAASADPVPAPRGGPYVGPVLDWTKDSAQGYTDRLGTSPSVFAQSVRYPLDADDRKLPAAVRRPGS